MEELLLFSGKVMPKEPAMSVFDRLEKLARTNTTAYFWLIRIAKNPRYKTPTDIMLKLSEGEDPFIDSHRPRPHVNKFVREIILNSVNGEGWGTYLVPPKIITAPKTFVSEVCEAV